jgi:hypothetical protein
MCQICWQLLRNVMFVINVISERNKKLSNGQKHKITSKWPSINKRAFFLFFSVSVVSIKRKRGRKSWRHLKTVKIGLYDFASSIFVILASNQISTQNSHFYFISNIVESEFWFLVLNRVPWKLKKWSKNIHLLCIHSTNIEKQANRYWKLLKIIVDNRSGNQQSDISLFIYLKELLQFKFKIRNLKKKYIV